MDISQEEKLSIETSMGYSYDKFWDAIEEAANSKGKMNEMDVAVGLILEGVSYMKGAGMSESELIEHIKVHYNSFEFDKDGNMVESVDVKAEA
tara:strand:- start:165 stop:443 length:279 start_codon:yes stop_codon:yes gene_type:complete